MINRLTRLNLRQNPDFFAQASFRRTKTLNWFSRTIDEPQLELAIRIKKANIKSAVARNRLKRKLREKIRSNLHQLKKGQQLMLVTRGECGILSATQVLNDLGNNLTSRK